MSYIRTKHKIYEIKQIGYAGQVYYCKGFLDKPFIVQDYQVISKADTIEELCDGFYLDDKPLNRFNKYAVFEKEELTKFKELFISYKKGNIPVVAYGFIKTDKGLIYVAKMNENGELELI